MKCVKVESYVVEAGADRPSPLWVAGSSNRWWKILTITDQGWNPDLRGGR
jgi:hypothetical protein